ncbi:cytidine deaminase [Tautonia sociabilis]|uniref:Cytidine deaminase n=1 Tax=Tautonia sociabilis TaxID=2080755 RepID=A0A432MHD0_9BACT|nr:cytidine deaminase [Tautonia sociabilis]RUL86460.1 cytidine deaminase [Tautonia sociabilis]
MAVAVDDEMIGRLIDAARRASASAYCPYSRFPVGAAVLGEGGEIVAGCNVENASYGLTICGERNAIFSAVARGERSIRAVVVFTPTPRPTPPCGACRQVIHEFGPGAEIISACEGPEVLRHRLADLLPGAFGPHDLAE